MRGDVGVVWCFAMARIAERVIAVEHVSEEYHVNELFDGRDAVSDLDFES